MKLNGSQRKQLHTALLDAFPNVSSLDQMVSFELSEDLNAIAYGPNRSAIIFELIRWAEAQGRVTDLVEAALAQNRGNQLLQKFDQEFGPFQRIQQPVTTTEASVSDVAISNQPEAKILTEPSGPRISAPSKSQHPPNLRKVDADRIERILAKYVAVQPSTPQDFFNFLVSRAGLPDVWVQNLRGTWRGAIPMDAHNLVKFAKEQGVNPNDKRYTTLGCILNELLPYLGFEDRVAIVALIIKYDLYLDQQALDDLIIRYQVPLPTRLSTSSKDIGPNIIWQGPTESVQLQASRKQPEFLDVGDLIRAIQQSTSVCRIEYPNISVTGTGFLVANNLLLTNYHVLKPYADSDINAFAQNALLRFGCFSSNQENPTNGQTFRTAGANSILSTSQSDELDYVLLQIEDRIQAVEGIGPLSWDFTQIPTEQMDLNILQHPEAGPMKLALSSNGVDKVLLHRGLIQYSTHTAGGSSGAPCFDKNWKLVGIHHAERSRTFGTIREGILFSSIYDRIQQFLA